MVDVDAAHAGSPLVSRLRRAARLSGDEAALIEALHDRPETFLPDTDILREGHASRVVFVLTRGLAMRYRVLPDGGRQILTFVIPGDLCGALALVGRPMDHTIGAVTPVRASPLCVSSLRRLLTLHARIAIALWSLAMQEEAMLRERVVALGRRDASGRVAYLFCELLWRHEAAGLARDGQFALPLTQAELGDALGLTAVHINKVLQAFRRDGLIAMAQGVLAVRDEARLAAVAQLDKCYLHLDEPARPPLSRGAGRNGHRGVDLRP